MVGHGGSSASSYLADPTSPIPSHCAVIILFKSVAVHQLSWLALKELRTSLYHDRSQTLNQMRRSDQNWPESPRLAPFGRDIPMILRKSDEATVSSAYVVATAMSIAFKLLSSVAYLVIKYYRCFVSCVHCPSCWGPLLHFMQCTIFFLIEY